MKIYLVIYVTGYTSESNVEVFKDKQKAIESFNEFHESTKKFILDEHGIDIDKATKKELEKIDVYKEDLDLTFDGAEVYERCYVEEKEI
jgi:protein-tyrosine-phosphatase